MKKYYYSMVAIIAGTSLSYAGDVIDAKAPVIDDAKVVSGSMSLDMYSHFISYGGDVWGDGSDMGDYALNPSFELSFAITDSLSAVLGTWWDVNSKGVSSIGGKLQEVDVWAGLSYTAGLFTVSTTYQQWYYGGDTEEILDLGISVDTFLSPSITVHQRLDEGASGGDEGTVIVLGAEYGFDVGPVAFAIPVGVAFFGTDEFHGAGADDGFGYVSAGLTASYPLAFLDSTLGGEWSANVGVTYYHTENSVTVNNPAEDFVVGNFGIGLSF